MRLTLRTRLLGVVCTSGCRCRRYPLGHWRRCPAFGRVIGETSMPKPLSPCLHPGCPQLVQGGGLCEAHRREAHRKGPLSERPWDRLYGSARWPRFRARFLGEHPLCVKCQEIGVVRAATEVDHITPVRLGGAPFHEGNCQALCKPHHSRETARIGWGRG